MCQMSHDAFLSLRSSRSAGGITGYLRVFHASFLPSVSGMHNMYSSDYQAMAIDPFSVGDLGSLFRHFNHLGLVSKKGAPIATRNPWRQYAAFLEGVCSIHQPIVRLSSLAAISQGRSVLFSSLS